MTHQPVAYQIEDANGEFMCISRTKSTIRGIASKPLYAESALEKERTARIEAQQRLADMQELAQKACENLPAPESCSGIEKSLWDVAIIGVVTASNRPDFAGWELELRGGKTQYVKQYEAEK